MPNKEKTALLMEMFIPIWEEILKEFENLDFKKKDLLFRVEILKKRTNVLVSKKLYTELFKTYYNNKTSVLIGYNNKNLFIFDNQGKIVIKEKPSFTFSMMQILISLTRDRLKNEKNKKIKENKVIVINTAIEGLKKSGITEDDISSQIKCSSWYKKGVYYLKIVCEKKQNKENEEKLYLSHDFFIEEFKSREIIVEITYVIK